MTEVVTKAEITEQDIEEIALKAEMSQRKLEQERAERGKLSYNNRWHEAHKKIL